MLPISGAASTIRQLLQRHSTARMPLIGGAPRHHHPRQRRSHLDQWPEGLSSRPDRADMPGKAVHGVAAMREGEGGLRVVLAIAARKDVAIANAESAARP